MLQVDDKAPAFSLVDTAGQTIQLSDLISRHWIVVYFYPKDDTPGCTTEAIDFSHLKKGFEALGVIVLGISGDSTGSHQKFCQKYDLTVRLLSDPTHQTIERYGAWQEKQLMGRHYWGTVRSTFLIDPNGIIRHIWPNVKPLHHAKTVLETVQQIKNN